MERSFVFENYRNVGFEKEEKLVINNSLKKGEMGELIIVIGPNNAGKSNVLSGINSFVSKKIDKDRNKTTLSYNPKFQNPQVSIVTKNGNDIYSAAISSESNNFKIAGPDAKEYKLTIAETKKEIREICNAVKQYFKSYGYGGTIYSYLNTVKAIENSLSANTANEINKVKQRALELLENMRINKNSYHEIQNAYSFLESSGNKLFAQHASSIGNKTDSVLARYKTEFGINMIPSVLFYTEAEIKNSDLNSSYNNLNSNQFFISLFKAINCTIDEIKAAYDGFRVHENKGILKQLNNSINKKLEKVSSHFNQLYMFDDKSYKFEIDLDSEKVFFNMYKDGVAMTLSHQSTGFKWFFNLYFNLLCKKALKPGDIVIMDEPATNLHIGGQIELRKFLKDFAVNNDVVIILATHFPFLIDLDSLDELRVVSSVDGKAIIQNDFSTINPDDPDSLFPIKSALTVNNHILLDPDKTVVFVEGITDYNYMTAFKKLLAKHNDIVFIPIQGVGTTKDKQLDISKKLLEIRKHGPILMADSDKPGQDIKKLNEKNSELTVFNLSEIDPSFKTIESLFSSADLKKFGLVDSDGNFVKHSSTSALFKNNVEKNSKSISSTTKNNFEKLFKFIENL